MTYRCPACKKAVELQGDKPFQAAVICPSCGRWMAPLRRASSDAKGKDSGRC